MKGYTELLGPSDTIDTVADSYAKVPLTFRAIQLRCDSLSSVPTLITKGKTEVEWPFTLALDSLLWKLEAALLLEGAAYLLRLKNKLKKTNDIVWLNPSSVEVDYKTVYRDGVQVGQHVFTQQTSTGRNGPWTLDEMVYIRSFDPAQDTHPGIAEAKVALGDSQQLNYTTRLLGKYFESGAMPAVLVGMDNAPDPEVKKVESWFNRRMGGVASGVMRALGLSKLPTIEKLTPDLDKMVLPDVYNQARRNVSATFGIPTSMLEEQAANRATAEIHRLTFWSETVKPRGVIVQRELNRQLLEPLGLHLEIQWDTLDVFQEDEAQRAGSLQALASAFTLLPRPDLLLAMDILGYDLNEDQRAYLEQEDEVEEQQGRNGNAPNFNTAQALVTLRNHAKARFRKGQSGLAENFEHEDLNPALVGAIQGALEDANEIEDVDRVLATVWAGYP
jgi:hypothetical protein